MPWAFYLLLMQYNEDPFGNFPRAAIPAIIGVFFAASEFTRLTDTLDSIWGVILFDTIL